MWHRVVWYIFTDIARERAGRDSSVGIATRYGLDGQGIECRWGQDFPQPSWPALAPTQPPVQWVPSSKAAGAWRWPPTPSSADVKERVELQYSPFGSSWPVLWWTLPLPRERAASFFRIVFVGAERGSRKNNLCLCQESNPCRSICLCYSGFQCHV